MNDGVKIVSLGIIGLLSLFLTLWMIITITKIIDESNKRYDKCFDVMIQELKKDKNADYSEKIF